MTLNIEDEEKIINKAVLRIFGIQFMGSGVILTIYDCLFVIYSMSVVMPSLPSEFRFAFWESTRFWFVFLLVISAISAGIGYVLYRKSTHRSRGLEY